MVVVVAAVEVVVAPHVPVVDRLVVVHARAKFVVDKSVAVVVHFESQPFVFAHKFAVVAPVVKQPFVAVVVVDTAVDLAVLTR